MKDLVFIVSIIAIKITFLALTLWVAVEFILYLAKDDPFNWNSLWWLIGFTSASLVGLIVIVVVAARLKKEQMITGKRKSRFMGKSRFMERLEEEINKP